MKRLLVLFSLFVLLPVSINAAWLTGYSYRMSIPVANPSVQEDKIITSSAPLYFLKEKGLITDYNDVHITSSDGTTELDCDIVPSANAVKVHYSNMPVGVSNLYLYYGRSNDTPHAYCPYQSGTVIDYGCERGITGNTPSSAWTAAGSSTVLAYNHEHPRTNSYMEIKITAAASSYTGAASLLSVTSDGGEVRFWTYFDTNNQYRQFGILGSAGDSAVYLRVGNTGQLEIYNEQYGFTGYTQNAYVNIGSYSSGTWVQWKVVPNFTNHTYTLSSRTSIGGSWTQYKASGASNYNIPLRKSTNTNFGKFDAQPYNSASIWLDEVVYSNSSITDNIYNSTSTVQAMKANDQIDSENDTDHVYYVFGDNLSVCRLLSSTPTTYLGGDTSGTFGISSAGVKAHCLVKAWEGALPTGTISSSKLHFYLNSNTGIAETTTLKAFKMLSCHNSNASLRDNVHSGWHKDSLNSLPTWNTRYYDIIQTAIEGSSYSHNWDVAGVGAPNIDTTDANAPSMELVVSETVGYKYFTLPTAWVSSWINTEDHAQGLLIRDSTDMTGSNNRTPTFYVGASVMQLPVLEVTYSVLNTDQLKKRKVTSDTYHYGTFSTQDRYISCPTTNTFATMAWVAGDNRISLAYINSAGRMDIAAVGIAPSGGRFHYNCPAFGITYDTAEKRYWIGGSLSSSSYFRLGYSDAYIPTNWTWVNPTEVGVSKSIISPKGGVVHCVLYDWSADAIKYYKYTRSSNTWSSPVTVVNDALGGNGSLQLSGSMTDSVVMDGSGIVTLSGTPSDWPAFGSFYIDSEYFWYTGKSGSNLTGVTRGVHSTKAAHSNLATVYCDRGEHTYASFVDDPTKECFHITYCGNSKNTNSINSTWQYNYACYVRHYYADSDTTWKDEAGTTLSLPIDQRNERVLNYSDRLAYGPTGILCFENGDLLIVFNEAIPASSLDYKGTNTVVARLANSATSFTKTRLPWIQEGSLVNLSNGYCLVSSVHSGTDALFTGKIVGRNYGTLWDTTLNTISDYDTDLLIPGGLWNSSCSETNNLGGSSIMYAQHLGYHGAIYLDSLKFTYGKLFWFN